MIRAVATTLCLLLAGCTTLPDAVGRAQVSVLFLPSANVAANKERHKRYGFGEGDYRGVYKGSCVAVSPRRVLTNHHCVEVLERLVVRLPDGREYPGTIVATDLSADLAMVEIPEAVLQPAVLGDSGTLRIGDPVVAIGYPYSIKVVSAGIVAGLNVSLGQYRGLLLTDAALNNGSSGGGLFDRRGHLVGINTARLVGAERIGAAIPINSVKEFINAHR